LNLLLAAKVVCNTVHMQACLRRFQADGEIVSDDDLRYLSPLMRRRLGLYGQYRELSVTGILLANSKSSNFNGFQIGIAKTRLQRFATAAAINLERGSSWLAGIGREKTRRSAFARMMRPLTA